MSLSSRSSAAAPAAAGGRGFCAETDPYALIDLLLDGALDRLDAARRSPLHSARSERLHCLSSALSIIVHLRSVVAIESDGGFGANLKSLYDHMLRRLPLAGLDEDVAPIEEAASLLRTIKAAWESLPAGATRH